MNTAIRGWRQTVLSAIVFATALLPAQAQQWQSIGLPDQDIKSCTVSQSIAYAASASGIYRLANGSGTWQKVLATTLSYPYWEMASDDNGSIYAVSGIDIFAYSPDGGTTWTTLEQSEILQRFGVIRSIGIDKDNYVYVSTAGAVYRSGDKGESWDNASQGLPPGYPDVQEFAVLPSGEVLTGTGGIVGGHVYITSNHGNNWTRLYQGVVNEDITALAATRHSTILAGVYGKGLLRSTNRGASWTAIPIGNHTTPAIRKLVAGDDVLYSFIGNSVYRSDDDGLTWSEMIGPGPQINSITATADGTLYATTEEGVYSFAATTGVQEDATASAVAVAPMPVDNEAVCTVHLTSPATVKITLIDASGRTVLAPADRNYSAGTHSIALNTTGLAPGLYSLRLETGTSVSVHTFIITH